MAVPDQQKAAFVSAIRTSATGLLNALDIFRAIRRQYDNLDYFNALTNEDVSAAAEGLTKAQLISAVSSLAAIDTFVTDNHHDDALYVVR